MSDDLSKVCGWRLDLESSQRGEFWVDREILTQVMSRLSPSERAMFRWGMVESFNRGLDRILNEDQAVGELREGFNDT